MVPPGGTDPGPACPSASPFQGKQSPPPEEVEDPCCSHPQEADGIPGNRLRAPSLSPWTWPGSGRLAQTVPF